jgi:quinol-cytochrome oxidoreductase complex cytochrome b subunit
MPQNDSVGGSSRDGLGVSEVPPKRVNRWLVVFWVVIVAKCVGVLAYYGMASHPPPVGAVWIIAPTLLFAALVSVILLRHKV